MGLNERHAELLQARGLDVELLVRLGVVSSDRLDGDCVAIPFEADGQVVNWKFRTISGEKRFTQEKGARKCFWNVDVLTDASLAGQPLIIAEGEFDAVAAMQAGFLRVVSVPDGAPAQEAGENDRGTKYSYLTEVLTLLRDVREIIICSDADAAGDNLLNDLAVRLGKARCKWVRYPQGCKDLNDALIAFGVKGVRETISRAQYMRVDGIYRMSELPPARVARPLEIGMAGLSEHYNIRPGDFCVITGIPSHGKSSFVNEIACRMVERYGWSVAFASFEQAPQIDHRRNLRTYFNGRLVIHQTDEELQRADEWIDRNFSFIVPDEDDDVTLAWTLERCAASIIQHGARLVVVDPWNEMDHIRPSDMSLTEYTGFAIKQFRKLARKYQVHLIVCAHPAKQRKGEDGKFQIPTLYDISDSAHWYNKPDVGIIVHREDQTKTIIRVAKSRYHDEIGVPGDINVIFNRGTNRYSLLTPATEFQAA